MADIAMCNGKDCPHKESCYRHTAKPNPVWQDHIGEALKKGKRGFVYCDNFRSIEGVTIEKLLSEMATK